MDQSSALPCLSRRLLASPRARQDTIASPDSVPEAQPDSAADKPVATNSGGVRDQFASCIDCIGWVYYWWRDFRLVCSKILNDEEMELTCHMCFLYSTIYSFKQIAKKYLAGRHSNTNICGTVSSRYVMLSKLIKKIVSELSKALLSHVESTEPAVRRGVSSCVAHLCSHREPLLTNVLGRVFGKLSRSQWYPFLISNYSLNTQYLCSLK